MQSPDLMSRVLLAAARQHRGWCAAFVALGETCSVWRAAVADVGVLINGWEETSIEISKFSKLPDEYVLPLAHSAYDYQLRILPRWQFNIWDDWDGLDWAPPLSAPALGLFLEVPDTDGLPEGWVRRTECQLTIINQRERKLDRARFFRHAFCAEAHDWGFGEHGNTLSGDELVAPEGRDGPEGGFVERDTLRLRVRLRVHAGRLSCSTDCVPHALLLRDGLKEHWQNASRFYCDLCQGPSETSVDSSQLHRCAAGCNFDVCTACLEANREGGLRLATVGGPPLAADSAVPAGVFRACGGEKAAAG